MLSYITWCLVLLLCPTVSLKEYELTSIQDICDAFMVSKANCTCQNEELKSVRIEFPELCRENKDIRSSNSTKVVIIYESVYSQIYASITFVISLLAIGGNSLVLAISYKNKKSLISFQRLITQLAFWDMLFAVLQLITCVRLFWTNRWIYGTFLCKFLHGSLTMGSFISIGIIFIITIERYLAVAFPFFWKSGTRKLSLVLSLVNVFAAVSSIIPRLIYLQTTPEGQCIEKMSKGGNLKYQIFTITVYFSIPVVVMVCLQWLILKTLREKRFKTQSQLDLRTKSINRRVTIVLISILTAFVVFISPNRIVLLYLATRRSIDEGVYFLLSFIALLPYSFHVAINPLLYSIIDKTWRRQAVDFLKNSIGRRNTDSRSHNTTDGRQRTRSLDSQYRLKTDTLLCNNTLTCSNNAPPRRTLLLSKTPQTDVVYL